MVVNTTKSHCFGGLLVVWLDRSLKFLSKGLQWPRRKGDNPFLWPKCPFLSQHRKSYQVSGLGPNEACRPTPCQSSHELYRGDPAHVNRWAWHTLKKDALTGVSQWREHNSHAVAINMPTLGSEYSDQWTSSSCVLQWVDVSRRVENRMYYARPIGWWPGKKNFNFRLTGLDDWSSWEPWPSRILARH